MKFRHKFNLVLILLVIAEFIGICCLYNKLSKTSKIDPEIISQIDTLVAIRDTLLIEICKHDTIIQKVKVKYQEDSCIISNQSVYDDVVFFTNYLSSYTE